MPLINSARVLTIGFPEKFKLLLCAVMDQSHSGKARDADESDQRGADRSQIYGLESGSDHRT